MERSLQVQVLATEIIKPSYPTPPHLRKFKFSLLDQITYPVYMIGVLFYKVNNSMDGDLNVVRISQRLKLSLSETLTKFYPFAGRIKDDFSIECNDDGVEYIEARANVFMSEYLQKPDQKLLSELHPFGTKSIIATGNGPLLIIQTTFFKCGGVAISASYSHKLVDALSFSTFLYSWAAIARGQSIKAPKYVAEASVFLPSESFVPVPVRFSPREAIESKRFVFDASKIAELQEKEIELQDLVCILWKAKKEFSKTGLKALLETKSILNIPESIKEEFEREEIDFFTFTSLASFPGYELADFGWGKPIHFNVPNYEIPNLIMFMPTADGTGIEALVSLSPEDMALFESNKELLALASVDPPFDVNQKQKVSSVLKSSL